VSAPRITWAPKATLSDSITSQLLAWAVAAWVSDGDMCPGNWCGGRVHRLKVCPSSRLLRLPSAGVPWPIDISGTVQHTVHDIECLGAYMSKNRTYLYIHGTTQLVVSGTTFGSSPSECGHWRA